MFKTLEEALDFFHSIDSGEVRVCWKSLVDNPDWKIIRMANDTSVEMFGE